MISGSSETLADPLLGLVPVKATLGAQPGSFYTQTGSSEDATNCVLLIAPNRLFRAGHGQSPT